MISCSFVRLRCLFLLLVGRVISFSPSRLPARSASTISRAALEDVALAAVSEELSRGVHKMNKVMTPEFSESSPVLKTFYSKLRKNVEIKESSIPGAGLGLFAKKAMKANTIVSFYPAHALGFDSEGIDSSFVSEGEEDQDYFINNPSTKSAYLHCTDQPIFERPSLLTTIPEPLYLDVNPQRKIVDGWMSQLINDGATVDENSEAGVLRYFQATKKAKNCIHIPFGPSPILATVTTKKVKKGEELFTTYGGTYWLGVWLDVHGEEGVGITNSIQREIQQTARDLVQSMKSVKVVYQQQLEELQRSFDALE